jgi:hypothetical protein
MRQFKSLLTATIIITFISCGSSETKTSSDKQKELTTENPSSKEKVKFEPFNNIDDTRQKLSAVGIGELGTWRDDQMGGYMSITTYYQFGGGNIPNNLAYYLESDNQDNIKSLKLVLNINGGNKNVALKTLAETVDKTYQALGLTPNTQIITAIKAGKKIKLEKDTYTEQVKLEKSKIETWHFIIQTK